MCLANTYMYWAQKLNYLCSTGHQYVVGHVQDNDNIMYSIILYFLIWRKKYVPLLASDVDVQQASLCVVINQPVGNPKRKV